MNTVAGNTVFKKQQQQQQHKYRMKSLSKTIGPLKPIWVPVLKNAESRKRADRSPCFNQLIEQLESPFQRMQPLEFSFREYSHWSLRFRHGSPRLRDYRQALESVSKNTAMGFHVSHCTLRFKQCSYWHFCFKEYSHWSPWFKDYIVLWFYVRHWSFL